MISLKEAFIKGQTYGGTACKGGCFMGKDGLKKIIKISKELPNNVFMFRQDNTSGLQPHFIKNGVVAKASTINPSYDLQNHKVRNLNIGKDVILAIRLFEGVNESVNEVTLTEKKYYVTYNKGRGQGKGLEKEFDSRNFRTTDKPVVFNSYKDAKKHAEDMEKIFRNSIGGGTAYWVSDEKMNPLKEAKSDYEVYHKSYTSAINAAKAYAEKKGYEINDDDSFRQIGMGPRKPSEGKTNKFSIELSKDGKVQRKKLQIQVYGMKNSYELNAYIQ